MWQHANTAEDNAIFAALSAGLQPPPGFQFDQAPGFQPSYDRLGFLAPLYWAAAAAGFQPTDDINAWRLLLGAPRHSLNTMRQYIEAAGAPSDWASSHFVSLRLSPSTNSIGRSQIRRHPATGVEVAYTY